MKKTILFLLIILSLGSCSRDEEPSLTPNDMILGIWKEVNYKYDDQDDYNRNGSWSFTESGLFTKQYAFTTTITLEGKWEWTTPDQVDIITYDITNQFGNVVTQQAYGISFINPDSMVIKPKRRDDLTVTLIRD